MDKIKMTSLMLIPVMQELKNRGIKFHVGQIDLFLESRNGMVDAVIIEAGNDDWNVQCPRYALYTVRNDVDMSYYNKLITDAKKLEDTEKIIDSYTVFTGESLFQSTYTVKVRVYL